jgi:hypothetical protein
VALSPGRKAIAAEGGKPRARYASEFEIRFASMLGRLWVPKFQCSFNKSKSFKFNGLTIMQFATPSHEI